MKILIVALNYAPEMIGCGKYTTELAEDLVARGHEVETVAGPPYYPAWAIADGYSGLGWSRETRAGVRILRTPLYVPSRPTGSRRVLHLISFGVAAFPTAITAARRFRPDVVLGVAPTLAACGAALAAARCVGAKSWLHVQDFEVDAAFDLGLLRGRTARRVALGLESKLLGGFDRVSTISPSMLRRLSAKGVSPDRAREFRNWVDIEVHPVFASSDTRYRRDLGIGADQVVALYSGNMAAKQGIEALAEVARGLQDSAVSATVVLCGDGPARAELEGACAGLDNVRFLPLQPVDRLPELLATADIHLLPQRAEAADLVLPSKLTGMLASGRPVVAMAARGSDLAAEIEGCGLTVAPDAASMAAAVRTLIADPERRRNLGEAARARAQSRWNKADIIGDFETALAGLLRV